MCPEGGWVRETAFVFFAFPHLSDCSSWLSSLFLVSQRVILFHWPLLPPWRSTQLVFPPSHPSRNLMLARKFSDEWGKDSHTVVMWKMLLGLGEVKWKGGRGNVSCAPSWSPHLTLELLRILQLTQPQLCPLVSSSIWLPVTLHFKILKEREQISPLCPSYMFMTPS